MRRFLLLLIVVLLVSCAPLPSQPASQSEPVLSEPVLSAPLPSEVSPQGTFDLDARVVHTQLLGNPVTLLEYNGLFPGPALHVKQNSALLVNFTNHLPVPTSIHWHGLRLDNAADGAVGVTQEPVLPNMSFSYNLTFPDAGVYWYHSHLREDLQQELGLYGAIIVEPTDGSFNTVDSEETLILDDVLLGQDGQPAFSSITDHALMGRFGNVMLVNGKPDFTLNARAGTLRLYLVNAANTRIFNFSIAGVPLKVVGGDSGLYEHEFMADSVILAPGERAIIEVLLNTSGDHQLLHVDPEQRYSLGMVHVMGEKEDTSFASLHENPATIADVNRLRPYFNKTPDYTINLLLSSMMGMGGTMMQGGMMGHEMASIASDGGIEWEDRMLMMNTHSTNESVRWALIDNATGHAPEISVHVGDVKKIRLVNSRNSLHPMQHPIHIHGQRFLVVAVDGKPIENHVWKDTVLVPVGSTVDILVDFTNPGDWMMHCHIAEHLQSGMMGMFHVS